MDVNLRQRADLMAENYMTLKRSFKWETALTNHFGAMVHTTRGKRVDAARLDKVRRHLKEETGWASPFRGFNLHLLANLFCLEEDYKGLFSKVADLHGRLKDAGFRNSIQLPLSAYALGKETNAAEWAYRIGRMDAFYKRMKEHHFWLTSTDDYVHAAILAAADLEVERTAAEIERCLDLLHEEGFHKSNYLQTLSHILALGEEGAASKCRKAARIFRELKERGLQLNYFGFASVGVLALVASDVGSIVNDVQETFDYLYHKEGYGFWSTDKSTRSMMAASLVSDHHLEGLGKGILQVTLGNSIHAIVIAQQSAAIAAACAASAAASSGT